MSKWWVFCKWVSDDEYYCSARGMDGQHLHLHLHEHASLVPSLRSIRRSVRGGSVKLKQQNYDHLKENGDIGTMNRTSASRKVQDLDIKMLQAKRQQAEMRRWGLGCNNDDNDDDNYDFVLPGDEKVRFSG